jgi:hypothetical protein
VDAWLTAAWKSASRDIDVAELQALIAAAETAEAELARAQQRPSA